MSDRERLDELITWARGRRGADSSAQVARPWGIGLRLILVAGVSWLLRFGWARVVGVTATTVAAIGIGVAIVLSVSAGSGTEDGFAGESGSPAAATPAPPAGTPAPPPRPDASQSSDSGSQHTTPQGAEPQDTVPPETVPPDTGTHAPAPTTPTASTAPTTPPSSPTPILVPVAEPDEVVPDETVPDETVPDECVRCTQCVDVPPQLETSPNACATTVTGRAGDAIGGGPPGE